MIIIFRHVIEGEEFLSLSTEELIKLISDNFLKASEEKVSKFSKPKFIIVFFFTKQNQKHYYIYFL